MNTRGTQRILEPAPHFVLMCRRLGLPVPSREYKFATADTPPRGWRFDYAWINHNVALEVEGGVWTGGRHTRGTGFLRDMEKYNRAAVLGWRVLRTTPAELTDLSTFRMLGDVFGVAIPEIGSL